MKIDSCIFCSIIAQELPTQFVFTNEAVVVIHDRVPRAPIHYLIIPKKHLCNVYDVESTDSALLADIFFAAQKVAQQHLKGESFRLIMNNGAGVGQSVFHMHMHMIAGIAMADF